MKRITILLLLLLVSTISLGQDFAGIEAELYLNKELKVKLLKESSQKYGFRGFYTDEALKNVYKGVSNRSSEYSSLVQKVFKVIGVEKYKDIINNEKFKLKLENNEIGILYYEYDPRHDFLFPFEVIGGLKLPEDFYCKNITKVVDKFNGEARYNTNSGGIFFLKVEKDNTSIVYLSINQPTSTFTIGKKGLIILLENNKRIDKPEANIEVKSNGSGGYYNNAFIELNANDIKLLKENLMTDARLYVTDSEIDNAEKYKELLKCLTK